VVLVWLIFKLEIFVFFFWLHIVQRGLIVMFPYICIMYFDGIHLSIALSCPFPFSNQFLMEFIILSSYMHIKYFHHNRSPQIALSFCPPASHWVSSLNIPSFTTDLRLFGRWGLVSGHSPRMSWHLLGMINFHKESLQFRIASDNLYLGEQHFPKWFFVCHD
jgi:hypothetical protein